MVDHAKVYQNTKKDLTLINTQLRMWKKQMQKEPSKTQPTLRSVNTRIGLPKSYMNYSELNQKSQTHIRISFLKLIAPNLIVDV